MERPRLQERPKRFSWSANFNVSQKLTLWGTLCWLRGKDIFWKPGAETDLDLVAPALRPLLHVFA